MKKPRTSALLIAVLPVMFGLAPMITFAEDGGSQSNQVQIEANVNTDEGSTTIQSDTESEVDSNNGGDMQEQGGLRASTTERGSRESEHIVRNNQNVSNEQGDQNDQEEMDIGRDSVDTHASSTVEIEHADNVHNKSDLKHFAETKLKGDENADEVKLSSTTVETAYPTHARLFGFIPMSLQTHVAVNNDGTVSVTFPWYAFFFGTEKDKLQSDITEAAQTAVGSTTASTTLSAQMQAHLLDAILSTLHATFSN
jgi:hypothetical protein